MKASQHGNAFVQPPPLTQPQSWDETSTDGANGEMGYFASSGKIHNDTEASGKTADTADGLPTFEVEECDVNNRRDGDFGDSFKLLTQSNELFKESALNDGDSCGDGSSDDSSSSGGDDGNSVDSSSEEENDETPIQVRRERNIRRNEAFAKSLQLQLSAMNDAAVQPTEGGRPPKQKSKVIDPERDVDCKDEIIQRKKRGMVFSNSPANKRHQSFSNVADSSVVDLPPTLTTKSLVDELNPNYPHRSKQIRILCSQLVTIVQKSKFAWQMSDNIRSSGNIQYSEASYQGDTKLAAPSPILITGTGGVGKTCIVRDALKALRRRTSGGSEAGTNPTLADAYVDCASSESGSVAAVMNSAYIQLYECFQPSSSFGCYGKVRVNGNAKAGKKGRHVSGIARSSFGADDFVADSESEAEAEAEAEDADAEDLIERQRRRRSGKARGNKTEKKVKSMSHKTKMPTNDLHKNVRQTRLRTNLATSAACEPMVEKLTDLKRPIQSSVNRHVQNRIQNSGTVALFGRATSTLIQGGATGKKTSKNWRCAFLILDNADRILSWKKQGSINPLTQILLLPSVMGINLTLIFISRSTIFQYSAIHNAPASLLDAVHPQKIHFDSYNSVEMIKTVLHAPHIKLSIIGLSTTTSHMFSCAIANGLRSKLNEFMYTSMMNSFIPSVKSSTQDITEIMRLARLLWPEYVAPLDGTNSSNDPSLKDLVWQVLLYLWRDTASNGHCHDSNCSFCQRLSSGTVGDASDIGLSVLKQRLSEKLDRNIRDNMRSLLSNTVMMRGRVLDKQNIEPYAKRLPYITKFLLLAAFLCQSKRPEQDLNLFTTQNTGKSKRKGSKKSVEGVAYVSSSKELKQRQPSFPLERLLSVFHSVISQYGQHFMNYKEKGTSIVAQLGTEYLFRNISQLITSGLLRSIGSVKFNEKFNHDPMSMMSAKFSCMISRNDALIIASSVTFPLDKYCL